MNKLNRDVLLVMIQEFYCTNTREYTNIPSCTNVAGNCLRLVPSTRGNICMYTRKIVQ